MSEKDVEAGTAVRSPSLSSTSLTDNISNSQRFAEQSDLEKVYSRHEDKDVAFEIVPTTDPNVVNWDGPDDPENPLNWPSKRKWTNIGLLALITTLTPLASSMFAPGVPQMMEDFGETSTDLASFAVSIFIVGYAFGPLIIAPLSELYGRLWLYHICSSLFIAFTIACARSTSLPMLLVFRLLAGTVGSCPITVGSGSIADTFRQDQRGWVMSVWTFPILFGPSIGPVMGSYLSAAAGWQWPFWVLAIAGGVMLAIAVFIQRETYPPILLERKVQRLRKETGNDKLRSALQSTKTPRQLFLLSIVRPTKMLLFSPIVFCLSLYIAVTYGYMYILITTLTFVFHEMYDISLSNVGLVYLGFGAGQFIGLFAFGFFSDSYLRRLAKGGEMKPEYRLPLLWPGAFLIPLGLILYGWSAHYLVHWIVPIIGTSLLGLGLITAFMPIGTYLVDAYTAYAASAMAANTVLRSLGGAFLPLAGRRLYATLGIGWGNSLLAFIALAMLPMVWFFVKYGERIRTHPRFQLNL